VGVRLQPATAGWRPVPAGLDLRHGRDERVGAYADIDSGVAVAVMRNRFDSELALVSGIDRIAADLRRKE
jgi:hypothetical protein